MYDEGFEGSKEPSPSYLMKCAPVSGENWPAWIIPPRWASATVGYLNAAVRASTSCCASTARVATSSGLSLIASSFASSMLHEPAAAPGTHAALTAFEAAGFVAALAPTATVRTTVVVLPCDDPTAYAIPAVATRSASAPPSSAGTGRCRRLAEVDSGLAVAGSSGSSGCMVP